MCNAFSLTRTRDELVAFGLELAGQIKLELEHSGLPDPLDPRYRYSPRQMAPVLYMAGGRLIWAEANWGFKAKGGKPGFAPTNARDDKLERGWPWKLVSRDQRCLVPADGFFEPEKLAGDKQPAPWSYYTMGNRQLFMMAGLVNDGTFTVVTTSANDTIRVHNRMPVILDADDWQRWLAPGHVPQDLLKPLAAARLQGWRVADSAKNSRIKDHTGMVEPAPEELKLL